MTRLRKRLFGILFSGTRSGHTLGLFILIALFLPLSTLISVCSPAHDYYHQMVTIEQAALVFEEAKKHWGLVYITDGSAKVTHGAMFVRWVEPYMRMEFLDASTRLGKVVIQEWPINREVHGQRLVAAGRLKVVC